ncbi:hypothetical protein ATANTOWER_023669 [Ataeniobius toweri]|uniref:Uncharacterized protein n=1 Tax=Ataeniobius toweri TaxID=208326 RepID=A0ABU7CJ78_9TELE|nr:hypothetical protein [Ataeniobius toweri]
MDHLAIAHLPVHPPSACAQLKHCCLRITKRERQHFESPCHSSYQTQPLWGRLTTSNNPSSTNCKLTSTPSCTTLHNFLRTTITSPFLVSGSPDPSARSSASSVSF